ncbi:hypothetical protein lerEdw1_019770 [Lerista edwardsae]|nr:hypothetical protein lerEdw1_019770 [Lerista edwardsae]
MGCPLADALPDALAVHRARDIRQGRSSGRDRMYSYRLLCPDPAGLSCAKIGLKAIRPGNRTHNVQCGTVILQPDSPITTVLAIVTATGMFVLILITFFLIVCMWTQKKANFHVIEDPESASDPKLPEPQEVHEDSYSCQFPEEEHGDKMAEEKTSLKASGH